MSRRFTKAQVETYFCEHAQYLAGQVISTAFAECQNGSWLAWYLYRHVGAMNSYPGTVSIIELKQLAREANCKQLFFVQPSDLYTEPQRRYAEAIRAVFHSTGRRKDIY